MNSLFGELLPDWIDPEIWAAFVEMRKAKGKHAPLTEHGKKLIIMKLERLRAQGNPPNEVLAESAMCGYSGVYPIDRRQLKPVEVSGKLPIYHFDPPPENEGPSRLVKNMRAQIKRG